MARTLNVAYLVGGTVRRAGGRLRVGVELIRASSGAQVWGHQYEEAPTDVFRIQQAIANRVASEIVGRLLPSERATERQRSDPAAYDHFLRGNFYLAKRTQRATVRAIEEYQGAIAQDPSFVAARAHLAYAFGVMLDWGWPLGGARRDSLLALGTAAADSAIAEDPGSSDGWTARAWLLESRAPRTFEGVLAAFEHAISLDPRNAEAWHLYGAALLRLERDSAASVALHTALGVDPGRPVTLLNLALLAWYERRFQEARQWVDSALAVDPDFLPGLATRSRIRLQSGDLAGAQADQEAAFRAAGASIRSVAYQAGMVAVRGDTTRARVLLDSLRQATETWEHLDHFTAGDLARGYAFIGDFNRALDLLERVDPRGLGLGEQLRDPAFDPLRSFPRFRRLVEQTLPRQTR